MTTTKHPGMHDVFFSGEVVASGVMPTTGQWPKRTAAIHRIPPTAPPRHGPAWPLLRGHECSSASSLLGLDDSDAGYGRESVSGISGTTTR